MEKQNVDASLFPQPDAIQPVPRTSSLSPQSFGSIREPPEIFIMCSKAEQDVRLCSRLQQGFGHLRRAGVITLWHEAMIVPGVELQQEMETHSAETNMLSIHRLVQAVMLDEMGEQLQHIWAERVVKVLCNVFPRHQSITWQHVQRYLTHTQVCAVLIDRWNMLTTDVADWLLHVGHCVENSSFYSFPETFYLQRNVLIKDDLYGMIGAVFGAVWAEYVTNSPAMEMLHDMIPLPQL